MDITTLIIAVAGLVLSVIGLVWQTATWALSGSRATVGVMAGTRGVGLDPMWIKRPDKMSADRLHLELANLVDWQSASAVVGVEVVNSGRMPVTVTRWDWAVNDRRYLPTSWFDTDGPPVPCTLEAGGSPAVWITPKDELFAAALQFVPQGRTPWPVSIAPRVTLGSGKVITGPSIGVKVASQKSEA
jgi:hypothetical protein